MENAFKVKFGSQPFKLLIKTICETQKAKCFHLIEGKRNLF
jgi:hypothetical protein